MPNYEDLRLYFRNDTTQLTLECSTYHGNYWYAVGSSSNELLLTGPCDGDCAQCGANEVAFGFEPEGMGEEPDSDTQCLYIAAEQPIADPDPTLGSCYFNRATFFASPGPAEPLLVISADGGVPEILNGIPGPTGNNLSVAVTKDLQCECSDVEWCCAETAPPETYKLLPSGASDWVYMGESEFFDWGQFSYEFINARSYRSGECDLPTALTWILIAEDPNSGG